VNVTSRVHFAQETKQDLEEREKEFDGVAKRRAEYYFHRRAFPAQNIPADAQLRALRYVEKNWPKLASPPNLKPLSASSTIYLGTGEGGISAGSGILKSTNGGETWISLAAQTFTGLGFSKLLIDQQDPNTLYAAVGIGLSGVLGSGRVDPKIAPPGIYKTTNGGMNWRKLMGGLPTQEVGRLSIGISKSNPSVLYTAIGRQPFGPLSDDLLDIYKSTSGGESWTLTTRPPNTIYGYVCNCSYDNLMEVDYCLF
jgi:hypothetical protein